MILNATPVLHFALDGPRSTTRVVATPRGSQLKRQTPEEEAFEKRASHRT
jgi:hypothetical protein